MNESEKLIDLAIELQSLAQAGLAYTQNSFDQERFLRIREISAELIALNSNQNLEKIKTLFCNESGYQTPKIDTRAAIFENNKILLVQENNGTWSLPGGWVDVNESIKSNTEKEVLEEANLIVNATKIIACQDRNKHNLPKYAYGICKFFILCEKISGKFKKNNETIASKYFALNELPILATEKNNLEQIKLCFQAKNSPNWQTIFD
ncbi:MAG: NUDIX hydrolase N-terminal domain-containing protein [Lentisphaeria bacterium]